MGKSLKPTIRRAFVWCPQKMGSWMMSKIGGQVEIRGQWRCVTRVFQTCSIHHLDTRYIYIYIQYIFTIIYIILIHALPSRVILSTNFRNQKNTLNTNCSKPKVHDTRSLPATQDLGTWRRHPYGIHHHSLRKGHGSGCICSVGSYGCFQK